MPADLILAGASVRSFAASAIRSGLCPVCVDMFGDADLEHLLSGVDGAELHVVPRFAQVTKALRDILPNVPLIPVGGLENDALAIRELRQQRPVFLTDDVTLSALQNPDVLFGTLQQFGCSVPRWGVGTVSDKACRWLIKKRFSAGGQGVAFDQTQQSGRICGPPDFFRQEFIDGVPMSATFLSTDGERSDGDTVHWLGCALQLSGCTELNASGFQFCGNAGPVTVSDHVRRQLQAMADAIVKHWRIVGVFGIDVVIRDGIAWLIEVNPRITASHELHELGADPAGGHVQRHWNAWQRQPAVPASTVGEAVSVRPESGLPEHWVRLVVYADRSLRLSVAEQSALMQYCRPRFGPPDEDGLQSGLARGFWLADIPGVQVSIARQSPFCSVYLPLCPSTFHLLPDRCVWLQKILPVSIGRGLTELLLRIQSNFDVLKLH